jgi:1-deoxy-D-xylulose-5-phosphate synthase
MAYMRCIPNMVVAAPMDEVELRNMMYTAAEKQSGPFSIRYPRGTGTVVNWRQPFEAIQIGQGRRLKSGNDIAILSIGAIGSQVTNAMEALDRSGISAAHYDMRFVKPLDEMMLHEIFGKFDAVITVEDGCLMGGFGSAVTEFMGDNGYKAQMKRLGLGDHYVEHGTQAELYAENGYDAAAIAAAAEEMVAAAATNRPQNIQSA